VNGNENLWSRRRVLRAGTLTVAALGLAPAVLHADAPAPTAADAAQAGGAKSGFTPEQQKALEAAQFVYIQSTRKDGTLSKPAEIWFAIMDGALWVGSAPDSWRAKRIRAGRTKARIAIGKPSGPAFEANGAIVNDAELAKRFCDQLAVKYPGSWPRWEKSFREGLLDGKRVLIRYTPVG
jgi:hypothetical protein